MFSNLHFKLIFIIFLYSVLIKKNYKMPKTEIRIKHEKGKVFIQELNPENNKWTKMERSPIETEANEHIIVDLYQRLLADGYQEEIIKQ